MLFSALLIAAPLARAGVTYPDCANGPLKSNVACDTTAAPAARASALVAAMSENDKLANLVNNAPGFQSLGLAAYQWWNEALHGVAHNRGNTWADSGTFGSATQFPQAITSGAAFDDELIRQIGEAIGTEARAWANSGRSHLDFWTPNVNPFRDPRWGRGHETPGEDSLRNRKYGEAYVRGMQGNNTKTHRVVATCKHFAGYDLEGGSGATPSRFAFDAKISMQDLAEYYLPPFAGCARDGKAGSVMCSYNAVNGVPACADAYLMDTVLRGHWNWTDDNQYVVTDCDAAYYAGNAAGGHRYSASYADAVGAVIEAGSDNLCWATGGTQPDPAGAFRQGKFSKATLDRALVRQFQGLIRAGLLDGPTGAYRDLGTSDLNTDSSKALALRAAEEGIVLLKNDNTTLPLDFAKTKSLAMVGFWANKADAMLGGYSGTPPFNHDPVTAARQISGLTVNYANGPLAQGGGDTSAAVAAATKSDAVLFFGGIDNTVEKESTDRADIAWPAGQLDLLKKLDAAGKPVIVVKLGSHVDDTPLLALPNVKAILWAGYPGQDGGTAVMNIVSGKTAPSGRLPITMYPSAFAAQAPITNMALRPERSYPGRTYRWYTGDAVFAFGHGLHYTSFDVGVGATFSNTSWSIQDVMAACAKEPPAYLDLCPFSPVPVAVTNTGAVASDYVVLGFLSGDFGPAPRPLKTLAAYTRLSAVAPNATRDATLEWTVGDLARVDDKGNRVLYPGTYHLSVDQPAVANVTFTLTGEEAVLDEWPQPKS